jgi:hypothetical protein
MGNYFSDHDEFLQQLKQMAKNLFSLFSISFIILLQVGNVMVYFVVLIEKMKY